MIERAGKLCKVGGWSLIKVSNIHQDMRLDVPTVGTTTIEKLHANRASALVLEPGKTIMLEKVQSPRTRGAISDRDRRIYAGDRR